MGTTGKASSSGSRTTLATKQTTTRIIAVANQKGGVGKTDLVVNLSCQLASLGKRTLIIDLDPQANATDYLVAPGTPAGRTAADMLLDDSVTLDDVVMEGCRENLDLIPSHQDLSSCQIRLANDINMQFKLKKKLKAVADGSRGYDFVLIDTPPSLGLLMVNTLTAASAVIIPVQTHYFAMDGVVHLQETIQRVREDINPGLKVLGVVLTMYDRRTLISREVAEKVRDESSERVFSTVIPVNVRLAEAPSHHKSIFEYDPESTGAKAYRELAKEILSCPDV
ncbi:MAG TPA: ParA family protein [Nitrososphaerales archaeon]|nr:ParA family protein [Nitrososphaerales archaeon]